MKITLDSGKELTLEEVKEVVDKFQWVLGTKEKEYIPYPIPIPQPNYPQPLDVWYYGSGDITCR